MDLTPQWSASSLSEVRKPDRAGVPVSGRRRGQERPIPRGERDISRKAIAQGMSDRLRCPVCSCAIFLSTLHTGPRVQRASGIPCSLLGGRTKRKPRAPSAARMRMCACCLTFESWIVVPDKRASRALISDAQLRIGGPIRRNARCYGRCQLPSLASHQRRPVVMGPLGSRHKCNTC